MTLTLIIPAKNEPESLPKVIEELKPHNFKISIVLHRTDALTIDSIKKYESGSGWPSFYESLPDVFETKTDYRLGYARKEYHCKNCGGHHGHIFDDGPEPTRKRYCNNGVCLIFKPKS